GVPFQLRSCPASPLTAASGAGVSPNSFVRFPSSSTQGPGLGLVPRARSMTASAGAVRSRWASATVILSAWEACPVCGVSFGARGEFVEGGYELFGSAVGVVVEGGGDVGVVEWEFEAAQNGAGVHALIDPEY